MSEKIELTALGSLWSAIARDPVLILSRSKLGPADFPKCDADVQHACPSGAIAPFGRIQLAVWGASALKLRVEAACGVSQGSCTRLQRTFRSLTRVALAGSFWSCRHVGW